MGFGPGKYGANAEKILMEFGGRMCVVIVVEGREGSAFDVAVGPEWIGLTADLPRLLRQTAKNIEQELRTKGTVFM